jgi:hypothetical protein
MNDELRDIPNCFKRREEGGWYNIADRQQHNAMRLSQDRAYLPYIVSDDVVNFALSARQAHS